MNIGFICACLPATSAIIGPIHKRLREKKSTAPFSTTSISARSEIVMTRSVDIQASSVASISHQSLEDTFPPWGGHGQAQTIIEAEQQHHG